MSDNDAMSAQELHELGVSAAVHELKTKGHEIVAVNSDITQMPQVVTRKDGTLRFIYVGTATYPNSADRQRINVSTLIEHAERNDALPFFARVQLAKAGAADDAEKGQLHRGHSVVCTFQDMRMMVRTDRVYVRDGRRLRTIASRQLEESARRREHQGVSDNPFVALVRRAHESRWCTKPFCTTCGATEYRKALDELVEKLGDEFAVVLADLEPSELMAVPNWQGALHILFLLWPLPIRRISVLESWASKIRPENVKFVDFVLYRFIQGYPERHPLRMRWIPACIELALTTRNESLVESLVLTLGQHLRDCHDLLDLAIDMAPSCKNLRRALKSKGFAEIGPT